VAAFGGRYHAVMTRPTAGAALVLVVLFAACATTASPPAQAPGRPVTPATPPLGYRPAVEIRWIMSSAEYVAATLQTFRAANARVEDERSIF
jgi:hypothetical protein